MKNLTRKQITSLLSIAVVLVAIGILTDVRLASEKPFLPAHPEQPSSDVRIPPQPSVASPMFPGVAVIDLPRVVAGHPWTEAYEQLYREALSYIPENSDNNSKQKMRFAANEQLRLSQERVVRDIQKIVSSYCAIHGLCLVLNSPSSGTNAQAAVLYGAGTTDLRAITESPDVADVTTAVLLVIQRERQNPLHSTAGVLQRN